VIAAMMADPEALLVAVPLLGAVAAFLLGPRGRGLLVAVVSLLTAVATGLLLVRVTESGAYTQALGGWVAPLGIVWRIDGLAAVMALLNTLVGLPVNLYALAYFRGGSANEEKARHFWPLWLLLWGALYALFFSGDLFNMYVTLELTGLSAVALIALSGKAGALRGAMRYLLLALGASLLYLAGVAVLYAAYGVLDAASLAAAISPGRPASLALGLITVGLLIKTALFPFHFWLPPAHANAPSPVSAVLSALVVKGGFYLLLRLLTEVFPAAMTMPLYHGLGWLGAGAILWGSVLAVRQQRLKLLIAYSTVAQLGYLFLLFPLVLREGIGLEGAASRAWAGGVYHALAHGLAKASLFLAAGVLIHARGDDRMEGLRGLGARLPMTATAMALAGISLMGIPPGAGFIAKWLLLTAAVATGAWGWAAVMIAGGLFAVGYLFRIYRRLLTEPSGGEDAAATFHTPPRSMEMAALLLALLAILFGLSAMPVFSVLAEGAPELFRTYLEGTP
jgi:formate hydrogenlyase subunit 3/multisubunit Na+/H+ antiporter MnhD subunit